MVYERAAALWEDDNVLCKELLGFPRVPMYLPTTLEVGHLVTAEGAL